MKNPATEKQTPLERQLTVVLAWLAQYSDPFARTLLRRFLAGDTEALLATNGDGLRIGARTWGTLRAISGVTGPLFPDLTITGSGRSFELIIEMKVDAAMHKNGDIGGRTLYQPDAYAYSWMHNYDASREAVIRRVGTLTRDGASVELAPALADWRAADVRWTEVRDDLSILLDRGEIEPAVDTVAREALDAIDHFVLATAVPGIEAKLEHLPSELTWGYHLLTLLGPSLAGALPGGSLKRSFALGRKHVYVGCTVYLTTIEGERSVWLQVSPANASYSVRDRPVCLWVVEQADNGRWPERIRTQATATGFREETDEAGYKAFRRGFPMQELTTLGDETVQTGWLLGELLPIFAAATSS